MGWLSGVFSKEKKEKLKDIRIEVKFAAMPEGFWSGTAMRFHSLRYQPSDKDIMDGVRDGISAEIYRMLEVELGKHFPVEELLVKVAVEPCMEHYDVQVAIKCAFAYMQGRSSEELIRIAGYSMRDSSENIIVLSIDPAYSIFCFQGMEAKTRLLEKIKPVLAHELTHHYDIYNNQYILKLDKKLAAIYKKQGADLGWALLDNPSYCIRRFFIETRMESIAMLNEMLVSKKHDLHLLDSKLRGRLMVMLEHVVWKEIINPVEVMSEISLVTYRLGLSMALTILFANLDDKELETWKPDLVRFLTTSESTKDMPKVNVTKELMHQVNELIKPLDYRRYVALYEACARKLGLKEDKMVITYAKMMQLIKTAQVTNLNRLELDYRRLKVA